VTAAKPDFVVSATEVAVRLTVGGFGIDEGAVYVTLVEVTFEREPQVAPLQPAPDSAQVTPRAVESFWSTAVKTCDRFRETVREEGETETEIGGLAPMVMLDEADLVLSVTEVAVTVTFGGVGATLGAV
jgi:hypothetical protein